MKPVFLVISIVLAFISLAMGLPNIEGLQVEVLQEGKGNRKSQRGDHISAHYVGTLTNGKEFDASYKRGEPLSFTVGQGQVIKGWDEGLLDMAIGEKRKLTIAPHLAYGDSGVGGGLIPPKSTLSMQHLAPGYLFASYSSIFLVFETELVGIKGVSKDEL